MLIYYLFFSKITLVLPVLTNKIFINQFRYKKYFNLFLNLFKNINIFVEYFMINTYIYFFFTFKVFTNISQIFKISNYALSNEK